MKFAFILNTDGGHPDTYSLVFKGEDENHIYGVTGVEEGVAFAKKLIAEEGFQHINLCGDFTEEHVAQVAVEGVKVRNARYMPEEMKKLETMDDFSNYGLIIRDGEADDIVKLQKIDPACNLYVRFVGENDEAACRAAKELLEEGVYFMELCSWFDHEKVSRIVSAIEGKVPVGTCGDI